MCDKSGYHNLFRMEVLYSKIVAIKTPNLQKIWGNSNRNDCKTGPSWLLRFSKCVNNGIEEYICSYGFV